ncbi:fimbrial protein [Salmonella enterica]
MKTRDDRTAFALSCRLNLPALLRWLLMMFVLAGPGYAYASPGCTQSNGQTSAVRMNLPPSVTFFPGATPDLSKPLYTSPEYEIGYKCTNDGSETQIAINRLRDLTPLLNALTGAGVKLVVRVRDSGGDTKEFTMNEPGNPPPTVIFIGNSYKGTTTGTLYIRLELYLTKVPTPGFYVVPPLSIFQILPQWSFSYGGFFITTDATRIQYVPTCFVKARVDPVVNFGPVLTSEINSSFSMPVSFNVGASANSDPACGKNQLTGSYEGAGNYYLQLPLKVAFLINSGGTPSSDNKAILLKNENDEDNGLQLKISDEANNVVTFGDVSLPGSNPASQLGEFEGGNFTVNKKYTATLSQVPGKPVKTGKYRAQVTVKVSYY